jgi:DNA-binding beta-propeller fold protein YncE
MEHRVGGKTMKHFFLVAFCGTMLLFSGLCLAQSKVAEIRYESVPHFIKLPDDMNMGEGAGVATDSKGNVYVYSRMGSSYVTTGPEPLLAFRSASGGAKLLEFDPNGNFLREINQAFYGYNLAHAVRVDAQDNIWVVNEGANVILKLSPAGRVLLALGRESEVSFERGLAGHAAAKEPLGPPDGSGLRADIFNRPTDVAWDSAGNIYVTDGYGNSRVVKFDRNGVFQKTWGSNGKGPGQFNLPHTIVVDAHDNIYVGDRQNSRIQVFDTDGNLKVTYTGVGHPYAICISSGPHQYLYTSNSNGTPTMENGEIYKMELDGKILGKFGKAGKMLGEFGTVHQMSCSNPDEVYVAEVSTWRVQKLLLYPKQ